MKKICHIRCNDKYWEGLNVYPLFSKPKHQYNYYLNIIKLWDDNLKIKYLPFRKRIRDLVLDRIFNMECFDVVLESNQHCEKYLNENSSSNVLFFQQDDDDIFLKLPEVTELTEGINIFNYSFLDPVGGRRKPGYRNRVFGFKNPMNKIQSNHSLIFNKNNNIDLQEHKIYKADHSIYTEILEPLRIQRKLGAAGKLNSEIPYNYKIIEYPISIQFYHLHSISLWKHQFKFSNTNYTEESQFIKYVERYIKETEDLYLQYKDIPLFEEINNLYRILL